MYYDIKESGKRIKKLRKDKGIATQEQFADLTGLSPTTIANIEAGRKGTSIDTLMVLADLFDTSIDYLISGKGNKSSIDELFKEIPKEKQDLAIKIFKGIIENI